MTHKHSVTRELIESRVKAKYFYRLGDAVVSEPNVRLEPEEHRRLNLTTYCVLVLENGYTMVGHAACVDPAMYDRGVGETYAYENAISKIWALEGYVLANQMYEQAQSHAMLKGFLDGDCDGCKI